MLGFGVGRKNPIRFFFPCYIEAFVPVSDVGRHVGVLLPAVGGLSEKSAAVEALGRRVREGIGQRLGVIPATSRRFQASSST